MVWQPGIKIGLKNIFTGKHGHGVALLNRVAPIKNWTKEKKREYISIGKNSNRAVMSREICNCLFITSGHNVQKWKGNKNGINA